MGLTCVGLKTAAFPELGYKPEVRSNAPSHRKQSTKQTDLFSTDTLTKVRTGVSTSSSQDGHSGKARLSELHTAGSHITVTPFHVCTRRKKRGQKMSVG